MPVIPFIADFNGVKGDVADGDVKKVIGIICFLIALNLDGRLGVKLLCNPSCDAVKLHTVQSGFSHAFGQHREKIACSHRRVQDVALMKAELFQCFVNVINNALIGVVGSRGGLYGTLKFFPGEQGFDFLVFLFPACFVRGKRSRKTAPAHKLCKNLLFLHRCHPPLAFQIFE